ncbi:MULTISPECIES: DUF6362 family protein [Pseudomonadota]|uniref:DUF6362 family protein n=1 Tax=Pseudomonadota TaxID=1224 RepID=UPI002B002C30|nr:MULTISPECIES: DUF6362 family protein [Pseudomonadota]
MEFTPRIIEDRMEEAAITLRRLPNPPGSGPKGYGHSWPEYVHDAKHAYGYHEARIRVIPNAGEIQRMDECIDWLRFIGPEDARIVWLRAEGWRWRQVCIQAGCVRQTAWRRWVASLQTIANHLNKQDKSTRRAAATKKAADERAANPRENGSETLL